jgi:hypothetical protein
LTAIFVHPSAEHFFLSYFFRATFLVVCSSSFVDDFRFLFEPFVLLFTAFTDDLLRTAEVARVEVARRRVEETSADDFSVFLLLFASAAAASAFLSWLSL